MTSLDSTDPVERLAAIEARLSEFKTRADKLDGRLAGVESGLDSLRGLVGEVGRVDAALAAVEDVKERLAALESGGETDAALACEAARDPPEPPEPPAEPTGDPHADDEDGRSFSPVSTTPCDPRGPRNRPARRDGERRALRPRCGRPDDAGWSRAPARRGDKAKALFLAAGRVVERATVHDEALADRARIGVRATYLTRVERWATARLDVDGDGEAGRLDGNKRVSFETGTTVVVAVPLGSLGVGDVDGNANE